MTDLTNISEEELRSEINRRRMEKELSEKPIPLQDMNFDKLIGMCRDYMSQIMNGTRDDDDIKEYIFEAAIEAVYGKKVWPWINKKLG